jgi:hypothetical protein
VPFTRLPWIDPKFPQLSRRFAKVMAKRTAIERLHKLMKYEGAIPRARVNSERD